MPYEIQAPSLKFSTDLMMECMKGFVSGLIDAKLMKKVTTAGNRLARAVTNGDSTAWAAALEELQGLEPVVRERVRQGNND